MHALEEGESPWRTRLYTRLRGQAHPLLVVDDQITPAASLWAGTRLWTAAWREAGLRPGDRIVLALPPSPGFVCALLAGLWDGLTLALLPPGQDVERVVSDLDATASIGTGEATWQAGPCGLPQATGRPLRRTQQPPSPDVRLLLSTSGTTAAPRWIALSDTNLLAVIDSHRPHLGLAGARVLSTLPWHHAFGLVLELLPALLSGAEIIRDGGHRPDAARMAARMAEHEITHLSGVPLVVERLLETPGGEAALGHLSGGVIGGAPVSARLAEALARTRLRAGYGQTEASPGITLGKPGAWKAGFLGQPLGCAVDVEADGHLRFSGPNACLGLWSKDGLVRLDPGRRVDTGDIVRAEGPDLYFVARADDTFKFSNGRRVQAGLCESTLRTHAPQLQQVLLYTPDGEHLDLLVGYSPDAPALTLIRAREILGSLGSRLRTVRPLPPEGWRRTPKGDVDRRSTLQGLSGNLEELRRCTP